MKNERVFDIARTYLPQNAGLVVDQSDRVVLERVQQLLVVGKNEEAIEASFFMGMAWQKRKDEVE